MIGPKKLMQNKRGPIGITLKGICQDENLPHFGQTRVIGSESPPTNSSPNLE